MAEGIRRRSIFNMNKYQRPIVFLSILPSLFFCGLITVFVLYFQRELINMILFATKPMSVRLINQWGAIILVSLWVLFIFVALWTISVSSNLVGAFERLIKEMDDILAGKGVRPLKARPNDILANELTDRINLLMEHLPGKVGDGPVGGIGRF